MNHTTKFLGCSHYWVDGLRYEWGRSSLREYRKAKVFSKTHLYQLFCAALRSRVKMRDRLAG